MTPDGNCFYRALSYQLFGTQDEHSMVRSVLYRAENLNKDMFSQLLFSGVDHQTIDEHIKVVSSPNSWATQVEVAAAACVFEVPVYYCMKKDDNNYQWHVVRPSIITGESSRLNRFKCPVLPNVDKLEAGITLLKPTHFELFYYESSHYDAVVSADTGKVCTNYPTLNQASSSEIKDQLIRII